LENRQILCGSTALFAALQHYGSTVTSTASGKREKEVPRFHGRPIPPNTNVQPIAQGTRHAQSNNHVTCIAQIRLSRICAAIRVSVKQECFQSISAGFPVLTVFLMADKRNVINVLLLLIIILLITAAKEEMFYPAVVCLSVCP